MTEEPAACGDGICPCESRTGPRTQTGGGNSVLGGLGNPTARPHSIPETELIKPLEAGNPLLFHGSCSNLKNQGQTSKAVTDWGEEPFAGSTGGLTV